MSQEYPAAASRQGISLVLDAIGLKVRSGFQGLDMIEVVTNQPGFCMELKPNRSGTVQGIHILLGFLLFVFIPTGFIFSMIGAWPVFGFMGAELVLLYVALRLNQRHSGAFERLSLSDDVFTVERFAPDGGYQVWEFQPQWVRIDLDKQSPHRTHLSLNSKGQRLNLGRYLTADEKSEVAAQLRDALLRISMLQN